MRNTDSELLSRRLGEQTRRSSFSHSVDGYRRSVRAHSQKIWSPAMLGKLEVVQGELRFSGIKKRGNCKGQEGIGDAADMEGEIIGQWKRNGTETRWEADERISQVAYSGKKKCCEANKKHFNAYCSNGNVSQKVYRKVMFQRDIWIQLFQWKAWLPSKMTVWEEFWVCYLRWGQTFCGSTVFVQTSGCWHRRAIIYVRECSTVRAGRQAR